MNIALVIESIHPQRGGAETSTAQFAEQLVRLGCQVTVLTRSGAALPSSLAVVPIEVGGGSRAARTWRFVQSAADHVRKNRFEIVHAITPCPAADVYQPRGGTVPEMLERTLAMRPDPLSRAIKRLAQRLNRKQQAVLRLERELVTRRPPPWVIAISRYVADQLRRHYRFDPARVRLIFNGVEPDPASPAERRQDRAEIRRTFGYADGDLVLLCVAHNFKLKGVGQVVRALARCPAALCGRTCAVIVGAGKPSSFVRLAARLGVQDRVAFVGASDRVWAFYHAADVLVHPTFCDACSRVVLESLAAGLPVITTRYNGAAERIVEGRHGYVIDSPHDVDALAERIARLADDAHRRQCAEQAPRAVEAISMRQHATEVLELYDEIVRSRDTSPQRPA